MQALRVELGGLCCPFGWTRAPPLHPTLTPYHPTHSLELVSRCPDNTPLTCAPLPSTHLSTNHPTARPTNPPTHQPTCRLEEAITQFNKSLTEHRNADTLKKLNDTERALKEKREREYISMELCNEEKVGEGWAEAGGSGGSMGSMGAVVLEAVMLKEEDQPASPCVPKP